MHTISPQNNFSYLLVSLLLFLFSAAVIEWIPGGLGEELFSLLALVTILVGIKSVHVRTSYRRIAYTLTVTLGALLLLGSFLPHRLGAVLSLGLILLALIGAFRVSARRILFEGEVDANKIVGSVTLYLLLGLIWTVLYLLVFLFDPHAFEGIGEGNWMHSFSTMAYFSFTTLTTLGIGDIVAVNPIARFLAYLETITGLFYLAIVVSSLVSSPRNRT